MPLYRRGSDGEKKVVRGSSEVSRYDCMFWDEESIFSNGYNSFIARKDLNSWLRASSASRKKLPA
jgi:hypothetical protein